MRPISLQDAISKSSSISLTGIGVGLSFDKARQGKYSGAAPVGNQIFWPCELDGAKCVDQPLRVPCESSVFSVQILCEFSVDSVWVLCESSVNPLGVLCQSSAH